MTTEPQGVRWERPRAVASPRLGFLAGKRFRRQARRVIATTLILAGSVLFLVPFAWMLRTSLMHLGEIFLLPIRWIPAEIQWGNYAEAVRTIRFFLYLRNTVFVTILGVAGSTLSSSMVAYAFARLRAPGRGVLFMVLLSTMMLPWVVTLVPVYLLFRSLHWLDTYKPLVVPQYFGGAFYVFMLRQFFMTIPTELDDAARIDGCGFYTIYWRLILPLSKPALATVGIFSFYHNWNDLIGPLIYLNTMDKYTLPIGLTMFVQVYGTTQWNLLMAASVLALLPCLVLFFLGQRFFVQGITLTGLKG